MKAKEYLLRYKRMNFIINENAKELSRSRKQNDVENIVILERIINSDIDLMLIIKREIAETIKCVKNPFYRSLLFSKYIDFKTLEQIAEETYYSPRHIQRLHKLALLEIEKIIPG